MITQTSLCSCIWMQLKHMHKVSADASFCVVALGSLSADEQVSQLLPKLESILRALGRLRSLRKSEWDLK